VILVNGKPENRIGISDRGLQYGDGLFETIAYRNGVAEFLDAHLKRLALGCERLAIPFQQSDQLCSELATVSQNLVDDTVIKIIVTRGNGGRGYFANKDIIPTRIISTHPYPAFPDSNYTKGISLRFCEQTLSENPSLAGIKHLNRLEQVLARNEWSDQDINEGLMSDSQGNVIEGTMSNIFIVKSRQLFTPKLNKSGVSGIMRAQIMRLASEEGLIVKEDVITKDDINNADEILVCNSVIGIWPVRNTANVFYQVGPVTQQLQYALQKLKK
jgi:4-amino-4-deoxychorismate lyase